MEAGERRRGGGRGREGGSELWWSEMRN